MGSEIICHSLGESMKRVPCSVQLVMLQPESGNAIWSHVPNKCKIGPMFLVLLTILVPLTSLQFTHTEQFFLHALTQSMPDYAAMRRFQVDSLKQPKICRL